MYQVIEYMEDTAGKAYPDKGEEDFTAGKAYPDEGEEDFTASRTKVHVKVGARTYIWSVDEARQIYDQLDLVFGRSPGCPPPMPNYEIRYPSIYDPYRFSITMCALS